MSTCFLPVADDLAVGDEIQGFGERLFTTPSIVVRKDRRPGGWVVTMSDSSVFVVDADEVVHLTPPF